MDDGSLTFRLDGELTIEKLADAFGRFQRVLAALETEQAVEVRWLLSGLDFGSATVTARPEPLDEVAASKIPELAESYLSAARAAATGGSDDGRRLVHTLRELIDLADENNPLVLETADDEILFTAPVHADTVGDAPETTKSLGTVRGRVETLSHRKGLRFSLYDLATDRRVSCYLQPDHESMMRDAWGRVADVTGLVTRDGSTGAPVSIRRVTNVDVVAEGDAMGFLRARGVVGGEEPAEQVVRRIRDAS